MRHGHGESPVGGRRPRVLPVAGSLQAVAGAAARSQRLAATLRAALATLAVGVAVAATPAPAEAGRLRNTDEPFDYFSNSWSVVGLKDYTFGTRITPSGEWLLGDGLRCRAAVGVPPLRLSRQVAKTLRHGYLPIVRYDFVLDEAVRYTFESFACPLAPDRDAEYEWPAQDNFLTVVAVTCRNVGPGPATAALTLEWVPAKDELACELRTEPLAQRPLVLAGGRVLAGLQVPAGAAGALDGRGVRISQDLAPAAVTEFALVLPYQSLAPSPGDDLRAVVALDVHACAERVASFWEALLARAARFEVPEAKAADTYKASLVYQFIGRDRGAVHAGEGFYDSVFLRDGAYQAISLAQAGYLAEARQSIEVFPRSQQPGGECTQGGQLDGNGYMPWCVVEYYRLSRDREWLERQYPAVVGAVRWAMQARRRETDPGSPFLGVLPAAVADGENLWDGHHHILGYDWWNLRGVQSAAVAARALGRTEEATEFEREFAAYRDDILRAVERTGLPYFPPSYEKAGTHWGNLEVVFPTLLIDPRDPRLSATLDFVRTRFGQGPGQPGGLREGTLPWSPPASGAIHPYMSQFVTHSHIVRGETAAAVAGFYSFLLHTSSTHAFPEGVIDRRRFAWSDTIPHLWAAALYVTTLRDMLIREQGDELHLLSAVPAHWLEPGQRVRVEQAPTHFGPTGFTAAAEADRVVLDLTPPERNPPAAVVVHLPTGWQLGPVQTDSGTVQAGPDGVVVLTGATAGRPARLLLGVRRPAGVTPPTFAATVAAYEADAPYLLGAIPGLAPLPPPAALVDSGCVRLDLGPVVTTDPFSAPFNVPNPGRYRFTGLTVGEQRVAGVPFRICDPAAAGGKGVVVLSGAEACAGLPREVTVPVGAEGRWLCTLGNVTGWSPDDPGAGRWAAVAEYEVRYTDGSRQTVPLTPGRTADDWAMAPAASDVAAVGLRGDPWHLNVLVIALEPKPVASVVFRDLGTPASPLLAAMTLVK